VGRGEFGTCFIGYAAPPRSPSGCWSAWFWATRRPAPDFSTTATGTLFFVPTTEFLDALPDPPAGAAE
jgi:porphyrinogen peroxidase